VKPPPAPASQPSRRDDADGRDLRVREGAIDEEGAGAQRLERRRLAAAQLHEGCERACALMGRVTGSALASEVATGRPCSSSTTMSCAAMMGAIGAWVLCIRAHTRPKRDTQAACNTNTHTRVSLAHAPAHRGGTRRGRRARGPSERRTSRPPQERCGQAVAQHQRELRPAVHKDVAPVGQRRHDPVRGVAAAQQDGGGLLPRLLWLRRGEWVQRQSRCASSGPRGAASRHAGVRARRARRGPRRSLGRAWARTRARGSRPLRGPPCRC